MNSETSRPTIIVNTHTPHAIELFSCIGNVVALGTPAITNESIKKADILITRSETRIDERLLDGSSVRFVGTVTAGTDHLDTEYLTSKGIKWTSAPGSNSNSVAEYVAAALLKWSTKTGKTLEGKALGVIGAGNVGSKVIRIAKAFGMHVLINDPPLARVTGESSFLHLDELMDADIITLHVPLTKTGNDVTYHLFDELRIEKMKRGSVLINTSRGAVIETEAMRRALSNGHLSTAILDVWEGEPTINTELLGQVMIGTPHVAGYSLDGKLNALRKVFEDVCVFLGIAPNTQPTVGEYLSKQQITIPENIGKRMDGVAYAVGQVYDIAVDDRLLRQVATLPKEERGIYFMKLRAEYRTRKEFNNWKIHLSDKHDPTRTILQSLGFDV